MGTMRECMDEGSHQPTVTREGQNRIMSVCAGNNKISSVAEGDEGPQRRVVIA